MCTLKNFLLWVDLMMAKEEKSSSLGNKMIFIKKNILEENFEGWGNEENLLKVQL